MEFFGGDGQQKSLWGLAKELGVENDFGRDSKKKLGWGGIIFLGWYKTWEQEQLARVFKSSCFNISYKTKFYLNYIFFFYLMTSSLSHDPNFISKIDSLILVPFIKHCSIFRVSRFSSF